MHFITKKYLFLAACVILIDTCIVETAFAQISNAQSAAVPPQKRLLRKRIRRPIIAAPVVQPLNTAPQNTLKFDSTLGEVLQNVKQKAQNLSELARKNNDHLLFRVGADFELYLSNWEKNHISQMNQDAKASEPLIQKYLSEADGYLSSVIAKNSTSLPLNIEDILNLHEDMVTKLPTVKHLPQVFSYSPYLIQPLNQKKVLITIKTLSFAYGKPKLHFNGSIYLPSNETSGLWTFEIETTNLKSLNDESQIIKAELEVVKPQENSTETENYKLPLNLLILPAKNGNFVLDYNIMETIPKSEIRSIAFTHSSKAIENECKDFVQPVAGPGRVIKNISEIYQNGESGSSQLFKTTTLDFTVKLCAKRQNKPQQGFPQGIQNSIWQWEEHWFEYVEKSINVEGIIPASPEELNLDTHQTKLQKFSLTLKGIDNRSYNFNGSGEKGLFAVKFNPASKTITVSPKTNEPRLN